MTKLLITLFVKEKEDVKSPAVRTAYATLSSFTGIILNLLLFAGKLFIGIISNSVSAIADAFNNLTDAGSSVVTLIGFRLSSKPVDPEHPHGHGRFEYIAAFIVDMIIILVGFELFTASINEIITPTETSVSKLGLILLGVAVFIKLWLFAFYRKISEIVSKDEYFDISEEMKDRFGKIPLCTESLLKIAYIRAMMSDIGVSILKETQGNVILNFVDPVLEKMMAAVSEFEGFAFLNAGRVLSLTLNVSQFTQSEKLDKIIEFSEFFLTL